MSNRLRLATTAALAVALGAIGWAFYLTAFRTDLGEDWMVYDNAIRAFLEGHGAALYDGDRLTALMNARFADRLPAPLPLHPWLYPPHYLLLLLPFGLFSFEVSRGLFILASLAALVSAVCRRAETETERAIIAGSLLLCPASAITACIGQNAFLSAALLVAGMSLAPRRPVLGGIALGILTYKPQLWLLVPVALIASRQWKPLAAAAATAAVLGLASIAVMGIEPWRAWIALMTEPSAVYDKWRIIARLNGQSLYTDAVLMGAGETLANATQALGAVAAAGCVWWCHRRPLPGDLRLAVMLAATMLAAPHVIDYDAVLLGVAATLFFVHAYRQGLADGDVAMALLVWASPLINPPSVFRIGLVTPLIIVGFIVWMITLDARCAARRDPSWAEAS
ncbi:MAG TPA: glycosyltransferase family 87 protein [Stellaceae bacterium]|nr:glycosyltransferase family 87 protein [Stellaceae bacterium]